MCLFSNLEGDLITWFVFTNIYQLIDLLCDGCKKKAHILSSRYSWKLPPPPPLSSTPQKISDFFLQNIQINRSFLGVSKKNRILPPTTVSRRQNIKIFFASILKRNLDWTTQESKLQQNISDFTFFKCLSNSYSWISHPLFQNFSRN